MKTISFIIPVFNEEQRLEKTFKALNELTLPRFLKLEKIIFVNDGSKDATLKLLKEYANKKRRVKIVSYSINQGKGFAIKHGMLRANSDYNLFFDADMSTPLSEISKLLPFMRRNIDVIVGTRKNGHSTVLVHQPRYRELLGKGFTKITQLILQVPVTDFTCGFKAFSKNATETIFPRTDINGWGYDAEILFLAKKHGFSMREKAVTWSNDANTKVKLYKAIPQTLMDLVKIRYIHSIKPIFQKTKAVHITYN